MKKKIDFRVIAGGMFVVFVIVVIIASFFFKKPEVPVQTPPPAAFALVATNPQNNSSNTFPSTTAVEFDFNKPIDVSSLSIKSEPSANLAFETNNKDTTLFIRSTAGWQADVKYTVSVNVRSASGEALPEVSLVFSTKLPKSSLLDETPTGK